MDEAVIMKLTGHKTLAMFLRYSHLDRELGEAAMEKLNRLLYKKQEQAGAPKGTSLKKEEQES